MAIQLLSLQKKCLYYHQTLTNPNKNKMFKKGVPLPDSRDSATEGLLSGVGFIELFKASFLLGVDIELKR